MLKFFIGELKRPAIALVLAFLSQLVLAQGNRMGVGLHIGDLSAAQQAAQLELVTNTHLDSVRFDLAWKYVETQRGQYAIPRATEQFIDRARARGIEPVVILDYGNSLYDGGDKPRSKAAIAAFTRYAVFVVTQLRGRVSQFEVWNEWDNHTGGFPAASPEDYAALFKAVYPALKAANPEAKIIVGSGVTKGWVERLAELGVVQMGDGVAVHPYNYQVKSALAPEHVIQALVDLEAKLLMLAHKPRIDLYVTEIGWPSNVGRFGSDEETVRAYASRLALLGLSMPFIKGIWWYELVDGGSDPLDKENRFGLFRIDLSNKPAASGLSAAAAFANDHALRLATPEGLSSGTVVIEGISRARREKALVVWDASGNERVVRFICSADGDIHANAQSGLPIGLTTAPTIISVNGGHCFARPLISETASSS